MLEGMFEACEAGLLALLLGEEYKASRSKLAWLQDSWFTLRMAIPNLGFSILK